MRIKIINDGKGEAESWEAHLVGNFNHTMISGYGADEKEALENLKFKTLEMISKMTKPFIEGYKK